MSEPLPIAQDLQRRYGERLRHADGGLSEIELQGIIRDASAGLMDPRAPDRAILYNLIGLANVRLGRSRAAVEAFTRAVEIAPASELHAVNLALCHLELKSPTKVLERLRFARRQLGPSYPLSVVFHCTEARALRQMGEEADSRAIADALIARPDSFTAEEMFNIGVVYAELGDDDDALEAFARMVTTGRGVPRGDVPAVVVVRDDPPTLAMFRTEPLLWEMLERASAEHDAPLPAEALLPAEVQLSPAAWGRLLDLVGDDMEAAVGASRS